LQCSIFPGAFKAGQIREKPAKIAAFLKFSFESDVLEAHIHEGWDTVDRFFIIEATRTNADHATKPLVLDALLRQPRFAAMREKIVHFVIDDSVRAGPGFDWERYHERARWEKFLAWNNYTQMFGPDDILIFGDADEIASREIHQYLRYCTLAGPVDVGTWFTNSDVRTEFRNDWAIPRNRFLWGSPTAYTLKQAKAAKNYPTRTHGKAGRSVWGGIHLSYYGYLPPFVLKLVSMTTSKPSRVKGEISSILSAFQQGKTISEIWKARRQAMAKEWGPWRNRPINGPIEANGRVIPWFIKCNPRRYQYFYGTEIEDTRFEPGRVGCEGR
jgi:hypothetical protein